MRWIRLIVLGALATVCAWSEDIVRRQVTYAEAVVLLDDRAVNKPRIEIFTANGRKVKGRLMDATTAGLRLERTPVVDICSAQWVRLPGAAAKPRRIARGIVAGVFGAIYLIAGLALQTEANAIVHPAVAIPIVGLAGVAGGRLAEHGQDVVYVMRPGRAGEICSDDQGGQEGRPGM
jgi:hypothetical protein